MRNPLLLVYNLFNYIVPPRRSETIVAALTLDELYSLQTIEGLPYQSARVAALVWELKYYANPRAAALAGALLANELIMLAGEEIGIPLLIPVPMHDTRRRERGHNQTEVLCKAALTHTNNALEYAPLALKRVVSTKQQQGLPKHKRLHNVEGSMRANGTAKDRVCIVVDDVKTTGATLAEAARALKAAGARKVVGVALTYS